MDTLVDVPRFPLVFLDGEVQAIYRGRRRFSQEGLRRLHMEKCLQCILSFWHGIATREPVEVHRHVAVKKFSKRKYRGVTILAVVYSFRNEVWRHSFKLERGSQGGLSGTLTSHKRRRLGD